ncbi:MAG: glycosyltransferase family 39 protein [Armatimonadetes bacterium]|nr:glycosyltransferase family 39 protein [Armatimonadota bacterium]MDE2205560.1 glycosyltransferase family 39 protein [Armatimonadota bacterium]
MLLRLVALRADSYAHLSWSAALLTDEGFYIHNARNLVLFGHATTDRFNNALLMPTLNILQIAVFRLFGVSDVSARMISVFFGLVSIALIVDGARRVLGSRPALFAGLLLGLDHVYLLYNRMALMDTPAACMLAASWWSLCRGLAVAPSTVPTRRRFWMALGGCCFALAFTSRGLVLFAAPAVFGIPLLLDRRRKVAWRHGDAIPTAVGAAPILLGYLLFWYLPNRAEMQRIDHYYMVHQLLPRSLAHLWHNLVHAIVGDHRGMSPYLFRHSTIPFALCLAALFSWPALRERLRPAGRTALASAAAAMLCAWLMLAFISYSPDRYYILFYPAMMVIAGTALAEARHLTAWVLAHRQQRTLFGAFCTFHLFEAFLHHGNRITDAVLYSAVAGVAALCWFAPEVGARLEAGARIVPPAMILAIWFASNGLWLGDWLTHITWHRLAADNWLARHLPANTVLYGDVAPGLCLNNGFKVVTVQPGLCNSRRLFHLYPNDPAAVLILDGSWKELWWRRHQPQVVSDSNRIMFFPKIVRYPVGLYKGPNYPGASTPFGAVGHTG